MGARTSPVEEPVTAELSEPARVVACRGVAPVRRVLQCAGMVSHMGMLLIAAEHAGGERRSQGERANFRASVRGQGTSALARRRVVATRRCGGGAGAAGVASLKPLNT